MHNINCKYSIDRYTVNVKYLMKLYTIYNINIKNIKYVLKKCLYICRYICSVAHCEFYFVKTIKLKRKLCVCAFL